MKKYAKNIMLSLAPFALLAFFIVLTDPHNLPLIFIPIPFVLIGFGVFRLASHLLGSLQVARPRSRLIASIAATIVLLIALLQSIGQLHFKDFLLLAVLLAGLAFYFQRLDA